MQVKLIQAANLVDGRLFTSMDDIYSMLSFIMSRELMTHQLPEALEQLKSARPQWFVEVEQHLVAAKLLACKMSPANIGDEPKFFDVDNVLRNRPFDEITVTLTKLESTHAKPTHVKPSFYAFIYEQIKDIAKDYGYNLVLHGSMNRDLDLIAIPWIDNPKPELELVHKIDETINEVSRNAEHKYQFSVLPGGRNSYVINICRGGEWNKYQDANYYLDISFTPNVG